MSGLTGLTEVDVFVFEITDLTDGSLAVKTNDANFTGGKSYLRNAVFLCHQLSGRTGAADKLTALTGVKLNVVDEGTDGDFADRKHVTGLDISLCAVENNVADLETDRRDAVSLFTGLILHESDVSGSVGVVFDSKYSCRNILNLFAEAPSIFTVR